MQNSNGQLLPPASRNVSILGQENVISFGLFELDLASKQLLRQGEPVALPPKAMDLLLLLASANGRTVERKEIFDALWPDTHVEERNLTQTVFLLRKALAESTEQPEFVITVPKRGYRLNGVVKVAPPVRGTIRLKSLLLVAAASLLVAAGVAATFWRKAPQAAPSSLVVLPFVNMSPDPDTEYFSDGLTEELINALTRVQGLSVVARTTAFQFKGKTNDIRQIGNQLNVDAVLEGSVRKQGDRLRVTAQLNSAADGYHYWSETFDRDMKATFEVQEEIANRVAASMRKPPIQANTRPSSTQMEGYNLYLRGLHEHRKIFGGALPRAIAYFEKAIEKDPAFARAYAAAADSYVVQGHTGQLPPQIAFPKAKQLWTRALELDPSLPEAYSTQGAAMLFYDRDFDAAERSLRKAIALNPSHGEAHHWYSHYLAAMRRMEESKVAARRALQLDPLNVSIAAHLAWHYNMAGDFPSAIAAAQEALAIDPLHVPAKLFLRDAWLATGMTAQAVELDIELVTDPKRKASLVAAFRKGGAIIYWEEKLKLAIETAKEGSPNHFNIAVLNARLKRRDATMHWLREAANARAPAIVNMRTDTPFIHMRNDSEFLALTRELGLP